MNPSVQNAWQTHGSASRIEPIALPPGRTANRSSAWPDAGRLEAGAR